MGGRVPDIRGVIKAKDAEMLEQIKNVLGKSRTGDVLQFLIPFAWARLFRGCRVVDIHSQAMLNLNRYKQLKYGIQSPNEILKVETSASHVRITTAIAEQVYDIPRPVWDRLCEGEEV